MEMRARGDASTWRCEHFVGRCPSTRPPCAPAPLCAQAELGASAAENATRFVVLLAVAPLLLLSGCFACSTRVSRSARPGLLGVAGLGLDDALVVGEAIAQANEMMGKQPDGPMPAQVEVLMRELKLS